MDFGAKKLKIAHPLYYSYLSYLPPCSTRSKTRVGNHLSPNDFHYYDVFLVLKGTQAC